MYVVYLVKYKGNKLPPFYIGSTDIEKINKGYRGSVVSKKYKKVFKEELTLNPHLFEYKILSEHKTRKEALLFEFKKQLELDVVKSDLYFNESLASVDGMFGRDVSGELNPMFGKTHTEETKLKIRKKRGHKKRFDVTDKHRKIFSDTHKGKITSEETKKKISEANKGRVPSEETKKKISDSLKGKYGGELHHMYGKSHSEETRKKISEANKGKVPSEEARKKISEAKKGVKRKEFSEEWKAKISNSLKGRKMSKESKDKLISTKTGMKYKESVCPHCNKKGGGGNMKRYHFNNCKLNLGN